MAILWASGRVVRAPDCCAENRWFKANPRAIVGYSSTVHPATNRYRVATLGKKGDEERMLPYLTVPMALDKRPLQQALSKVRNLT